MTLSFRPEVGRLAQLARAPARQAGGHRFEPCIAHQPISEKRLAVSDSGPFLQFLASLRLGFAEKGIRPIVQTLMGPLPRKLMSAAALLLGVGAIGFAALPVPADPHEQGKLARTLQLSPETTRARSKTKKPELPAGLDLAALPEGATTREVELIAQPLRPPVSEKKFEVPMALSLAVKVVDTTGRSLSGARLSWTTEDGKNPGKGRCDSSGYFESSELSPGKYQLQVQTADFSRKTTLELQIPRPLGEAHRVVFSALP